MFQQTRQATDFKHTTAAAKALGVDYKDDDLSYVFNLKIEHLRDSVQLSENFGRCAWIILRTFQKLTAIKRQ